MTAFYRKVLVWDKFPGYAISTETMDEYLFRGTLAEVKETFIKDFGKPTKWVKSEF